MSIGERIKLARRAARLSQRALAKKVGLSAQAISKYERGLDIPSSGVLLRLAQALNVEVEYFFRPSQVTITAPAYRKRTSLPKKQEQAIIASVQEWLERYLEVESLFPSEAQPRFELPSTVNPKVNSLDDVEEVAKDLRRTWDLGLAPIESMVELLEDKGIKVGLVDGPDGFDSCTFWANGNIPVIVIKRGLPGDRQRFNIAHELGHLVLEPGEGVDEEKAAFRFAGAFLVPEPMVRYELGERRHTLDLYELYLLKCKYGLSMQGWIYRAKDLGIIPESTAAQLFREFRKRGWHKKEPGEQIPPEEPKRMERLVLRALAEDLISQSRAAELLGRPVMHQSECFCWEPG